MAKNKIGLQFDGFEALISKLDSMDGNVKKAVERSLEAAHNTVTTKLVADMRRHRRTGRTAKAIAKDPEIKWEGTTASVKVGFRFPEGLPSVFLMYGTPRKKKDQNLYNDIYGSRVKKEIAEKQKQIFTEEIMKRTGG